MPQTRKVTLLAHSHESTSLPPGVDPTTVAVQMGSIVHTTGILGVDPKTGQLGDGPEAQFSLAFDNLEALLTQAGVSLDEVGLVTVYLPSADYRQYINQPWLATFPSEDNRPARKTNHVKLPEGVFVQLQVAGVTGERRRRLEIPGLSHRDPIPMGCRLGDMVYSSVIAPQDPANGEAVSGQLEQIQRCFDNTRLLMEQAGGSLDDVIHLWVFMSDFTYQSDMVDIWVKTWPQDGDRPARKTLRYPLGGGSLIQVQATAVLDGKRTNHEIPGVGHHDPIPMGSKIGRLFYSSGISGTEPGAPGERRVETVEGLEPQIEMCQANLRTLLDQAGGSLADVALLTVLISDAAVIPVVQQHWDQLYPDPTNRPGLKFIDWAIPGGTTHVQYHVAAVLD